MFIIVLIISYQYDLVVSRWFKYSDTFFVMIHNTQAALSVCKVCHAALEVGLLRCVTAFVPVVAIVNSFVWSKEDSGTRSFPIDVYRSTNHSVIYSLSDGSW